MSMTKTTEPHRILKKKNLTLARHRVSYIFLVFAPQPNLKNYFKIKELCDHDNYFWRETARNVGCKKRKEVRKEWKWKASTGIPRRSPIQLRSPSDRA